MRLHFLWVCALAASLNLFANRPAILIDDFESGDYAGWTVTGKAFGKAPATGTLSGQQKVSGYTGKYLVNTFLGGDASTGMLVSDTFTIQRNYITFLIGGGDVAGAVVLMLNTNGVMPNQTEIKLVSVAASFLGKQTEE